MTIGIFIQAFLLTLLAGASTAIGSFLAFLKIKNENRILSFGLGFSGGVMIYLSFVEILPKSISYFAKANADANANLLGVLCFFIGMIVAFLIDSFIPKDVNLHEFKSTSEFPKTEIDSNVKNSIHRTAKFTAIAITLHNFPEGFATFISAMDNFTFGISMAIAVAIHNIPEGLAVSLPVYYVTKSKAKAFKISLLSGLSEPLGAIVGYFILAPIFGDYNIAVGFGIIAGIMVFISVDSLFPNSKLSTKGHESIIGIMIGMAIMAISLILLAPK